MSVVKQTKYIFVLGGVMSGLGKGITASSIGYLLKSAGVRVTILKLDPYLNVDPGTMNPYQHGEVFVLDDGSETDLDLGHYERFIDVNMTKENNATAGQIYSTVLNRERKGEYLGQTVQVIPHITDEIIHRIKTVNNPKKYDVVICEVGGTVGDIESLPFMESIRQLSLEVEYHNHMIVHVTLLPFVKASGELKSKPTQHSVMKLREIGLSPDIIFCRSEYPIDRSVREKIALFCNVRPNHVIEGRDVPSIYEVPLVMYGQDMVELINDRLQLDKEPDISHLQEFNQRYKHPEYKVTIAMCGKYTELIDSYKSVLEAFVHAGVENNARVDVKWIHTEIIVDDASAAKAFKDIDGILLLPGFGSRGGEGKILSSKFAREKNIPFLGICLGMQLLFSQSEENGVTNGLGLIPGNVSSLKNSKRKVHIGWNNVEPIRSNSLISDSGYAYFVHSFACLPENESHIIAKTNYGESFASAIQNKHVLGVQFHPEKSQDFGLSILRRFSLGEI